MATFFNCSGKWQARVTRKGLIPGVETIMRQTFSYKRAKETFHRRIMQALHCVQMPANSDFQPLPLRLIDACIASLACNARYATLQYWPPQSE